jgi:hypothetical protein
MKCDAQMNLFRITRTAAADEFARRKIRTNACHCGCTLLCFVQRFCHLPVHFVSHVVFRRFISESKAPVYKPSICCLVPPATVWLHSHSRCAYHTTSLTCLLQIAQNGGTLGIAFVHWAPYSHTDVQPTRFTMLRPTYA